MVFSHSKASISVPLAGARVFLAGKDAFSSFLSETEKNQPKEDCLYARRSSEDTSGQAFLSYLVQELDKNGGAIFIDLAPFESSLFEKVIALVRKGPMVFLCEMLPNSSIKEFNGAMDALADPKWAMHSFFLNLAGESRPKDISRDAFRFRKKPHGHKSHALIDIKTPHISSQTTSHFQQFSPRLFKAAPNLGFCLVFLGLSFFTIGGYFLLGESSNSLFKSVCFVMVFLFSLLASLPLGFLLDDLKSQKPSDSSLSMFSLSFAGVFAFFLGMLGLAIGNANDWSANELLCLSLLYGSFFVWLGFLFLLRHHVKKLFKKRHQTE